MYKDFRPFKSLSSGDGEGGERGYPKSVTSGCEQDIPGNFEVVFVARVGGEEDKRRKV